MLPESNAPSTWPAAAEGTGRETGSSRSPRGSRSRCSESAENACAWEEGSWQHTTGRDEREDCAQEDEQGAWKDVEPGEPRYIDAHDLVLEPSEPGDHRFSLVVLHSCSGGPDDFVAFFHHLDLPFRSKVRAVVPCSPVRLENHYGWARELNSWFEYDATTGDGNAVKHPEQLGEQRERLLALVDMERRRLPDGDGRRMVLWGLSQGAGLALDIALRVPFAVGGVIALRGMALEEAPPQRPEGSTPVEALAINGAHDWLCPPDVARKGYEALRSSGANITFEVEPSLGHGCARGRQQLNKPELERVSKFLRGVWAGLA